MKRIEELWQYDATDDILTGNIDNLQREYDKGWNINEPLVKFAISGEYTLPVMLAIQHNNMKSVNFLIEHGADPTIPNKSGLRPYTIALKEGKLKNAELLREYEPNKDEPDEKVVKKLPKDLLNFLEAGNLKVNLTGIIGIEYIEFLAITDLAVINFDGRKGILLTREIENYRGICLIWNPKKKCVSYYEMEHGWYGDFSVSFQTFINQPERYMQGIFTDEFVK